VDDLLPVTFFSALQLALFCLSSAQARLDTSGKLAAFS
jgi:hypothetical protein